MRHIELSVLSVYCKKDACLPLLITKTFKPGVRMKGEDKFWKQSSNLVSLSSVQAKYTQAIVVQSSMDCERVAVAPMPWLVD